MEQKGATVSTWIEDFNYSLDSVGAPHPGDLGPEEVWDLIESIAEGVSLSGEGATVGEALAAAGSTEIATVVGAVGASWYVGCLVGAVIYASGKQGWDYVTAPIDLEKALELAKDYGAPILELPATEDVPWYPTTSTASEDAPPPPPDYPGTVFRFGSDDADTVELIQRNLVSAGYELEITREYDEAMFRAVEAFQKDRGLAVDGEVGVDTWPALFGS